MFGLEPEHFDPLGLVVFAFILWVAVRGLNNHTPARWVYWVLVAIGVGGLLIDGSIVVTNFILKTAV